MVAHLAQALLDPFEAALDERGPARGLRPDRIRGLLARLAVEGGQEP